VEARWENKNILRHGINKRMFRCCFTIHTSRKWNAVLWNRLLAEKLIVT